MLHPIGLGGLARSRTYRILRDPSWTFDPRARQSRDALRALHNSQAGAHGFIIGTGPSLLQTDFEAVRGHPTIGLNRLYLGFDTFGVKTDFLACVNLRMLEKAAPELARAGPRLVSTWAARHLFPADCDMIYLRTLDSRRFHANLMDAVATGGTVTYVAMQFAYWLGWSKLTLLGIDHFYGLERQELRLGPHATVRRTGEDANHFTSSYVGKGDIWQLPDLQQSEEAYSNARQAFEAAGRRVEDATVDGKLQVFPKLDTFRRAESPPPA